MDFLNKYFIPVYHDYINTDNKELSEIEQNLIQMVCENIHNIIDNYNDFLLELFGNKNIISTDIIAKSLKGFNQYLSQEYHKVASLLANSLYQQKINNNPKGKLLFITGGTGSGKSTYLHNMSLKKKSKYTIIYETILVDKPLSWRKINMAINNGYLIKIKYIHRDPITSFSEGVLGRLQDEKRLIKIADHIEYHSKIVVFINILKSTYPNIIIKFIDNTKLQMTESLNINYNMDSNIKDILLDITLQALQNNIIDENDVKIIV